MSDRVNDGGPTSPSDRSVVDEWRKAMEGVTPGEWQVCEYGDGDSLVIHAGGDWRICFMATPGSSWGAIERIEKNAAWIARCSPAGISGLLDLIEAQAREVSGRGLSVGIRETPARTSPVQQETAIVFRGGGRRFFTRKAAERAEAKAIIRKRCECCDGDWETPPEVCTYHRDPQRTQRIIHLLVVMFIRKEARP